MARILWVSNSRKSPTGYGNQTDLFVPLLKKAGHEVAIFAFYGAEGAPSMDQDGIITLPRLNHAYGNDIIKAHYDWHRADLVITLINPFVLDPEIYGRMNWMAWVPIEGEPVQPGDVYVLRHAKRLWAMSRFGETLLHNAGFNNVDYVPHGVNTDVFKPIDREQARARLGKALNVDFTGRFVVAWNAANKGIPGRKGWYEGFQAFKDFADQRAELRPILYVHSDRSGLYGVPLDTVLGLTGLTANQVIFAPQYQYMMGMLPQHYLNDVYNAADVYFHPSHGEGFGIPILEARAANCPVIVPNIGTMIELGDGLDSILTPAGSQYMATPGQLWTLPDVDGLRWGLRKMAQRFVQDGATRIGNMSADWAAQYQAQRVVDEFMLPSIARHLDTQTAKQVMRAELRAAARARIAEVENAL